MNISKHNTVVKKIKASLKKTLYRILKKSYRKYEIPLSLLKYFKKNASITLIDIGAHNGDFTKALSKYCIISKGLLIEPLPHKAAWLQQHFSSPNYQIFDCALSSKNEEIEFEVNESEVTSSILKIRRDMPELAAVSLGDPKTIKCQARTLDEVATAANFHSIDLLKIDVQGAEHLVLAGAEEVLKKTVMIWTEVSFKALYEGSSTFIDIYNLMEKAGFILVELESGFRSPDGELLQGDALFMKGISR